MKRRKWLLVVLILVVFFLAATPGWSDENSLQKAEELDQEVIQLYQQGRYVEAIPLAERSLAIMEKALGPDHHRKSPIPRALA